MTATVEVGDILEQDIINIRTLLSTLQQVLAEGCDFNAKNAENTTDSLESVELLSVATAIDRLSEAANRTASDEDDAEMISLNGDNNNDVRDITNKAVRQTIEENQDLKRQNILLEQQLDEKERRIKVLERLLLSEGKSFRNILDGERSSVNTASQTDRLPRTSSLDRTKIGTSISFRARAGSRLEEPRKPPIQSSPSLKISTGSRSPTSAHLVSLKEKLQLARSEQGKRTSSSTTSSSSSPSTSYLPSPLTPRRKFLLSSADPERTKSSQSLCSSNYNSSSGSSSYLLSPRSKLSGDSCGGAGGGGPGLTDCRHGWLYTQSQYKYNNRAFKPTIL